MPDPRDPINDAAPGFTMGELQLDYFSWKALAEARTPHLRPETYAWLCAWEALDFALSPMDDGQRAVQRGAHYRGWHARSEPMAERWIAVQVRRQGGARRDQA